MNSLKPWGKKPTRMELSKPFWWESKRPSSSLLHSNLGCLQRLEACEGHRRRLVLSNPHKCFLTLLGFSALRLVKSTFFYVILGAIYMPFASRNLLAVTFHCCFTTAVRMAAEKVTPSLICNPPSPSKAAWYRRVPQPGTRTCTASHASSS